MKIDWKKPSHWWLMLLQGTYTTLGILVRPFLRRKRQPTVVLYGHQLSGNLKALYEHFTEQASESFDTYFLSLDPTYSAELKALHIQVLQCNKFRDMLQVAASDVIITDHMLHAMSPMTMFTDIKFVDVWHGVPFKGFNADTFKLQHRYTETWVTSPMLEDLYVKRFGFDPDRVQALGYARADKLFLKTPGDESWKKMLNIPNNKRIVLYAPTWQQDSLSRSLFPFGETQDSFLSRLDKICSQQNVMLIVRSHLNATISDREYENVRYCSMKEFPDTESLLQSSDVLLCDWSSIAFDFLALQRPVFFLDVEPPFKDGFSLGPEHRYGQIAKDMDGLASSLSETLADEGAYWQAHSNAHTRAISDIYGISQDGRSSERQLSRTRQLLGITGTKC